MNNYRDYYNYVNNNYNQPNYNQQIEKPRELYDPYQGFIRGNLFPDLYNSYRVSNPIDINPSNEQAEILTNIDSLEFAMQDLNLYLDLNPNDSKMIELYNYYLKQYKDFMNVYQNKFGPIVLECDALKGNRWDWINSPWPWEVNK